MPSSVVWESIERQYGPIWEQIEATRRNDPHFTTEPLEPGETRVRQYGPGYREGRSKVRDGAPMRWDGYQSLRAANLFVGVDEAPGSHTSPLLMYALAHLRECVNPGLSDEAKTVHLDIAARFIFDEGERLNDPRIRALVGQFEKLGVT